MTKSMQAWESMLNKTAIARYFAGVFNRLAIQVTDTGESFTVHHKDSGFEMTDGIHPDADYVVEITSQNVANMRSHGEDGTIDADESFKIMSVLFTPLTKASLENPVLSQPYFRKLSGIENHIIVYLEHPTKDISVSHTLIYLNKEWLVVPGAHGNAKRVFKLNPSQAIEYQKRVFKAITESNLGAWQNFKKWYFNWRKEISVKVES